MAVLPPLADALARIDALTTEQQKSWQDDRGALVLLGDLRAIRADVEKLAETFEPDVAYMPVPRCESCGRWARQVGLGGICALATTDDVVPTPVFVGSGVLLTRADFGCVHWAERSSFSRGVESSATEGGRDGG